MFNRSLFASILLWPLLIVSNVVFAGEYDWEIKKEVDGIQVFTRKVEGSKHKAVRAVTRVNASLNAIVALVRDTKACPELAALCKFSFVERELSETDLYIYSYNDMPWPIKDRDVVAHAEWSQNPDDLSVTMKAYAVDDVVPINDNAIRLRKADVSWRFVPRGDGELDVITEAHIDPEGPVPAFITNWLLVSSPFETLNNVRRVVEGGRYNDVRFKFIVEPANPPGAQLELP